MVERLRFDRWEHSWIFFSFHSSMTQSLDQLLLPHATRLSLMNSVLTRTTVKKFEKETRLVSFQFIANSAYSTLGYSL